MSNKLKMDLFNILDSLGIGYKYLVNGFIGALVWSLYKKTKLVEALRQILIGSIVAGYLTPLIAFGEHIPQEYLSALSFVVGMVGMIILDGIYKFVVNKIRAFKKGEAIIKRQDSNKEE